jgi:tetratricopeptide (TPR) repeat protein
MKEIAQFFIHEVKEHLLAGENFDQTYKGVSRSVPSEYQQMPPVWGSIDAAIRRAYHSLAGWLPYRPSAIPSLPEKALREAIASLGNNTKEILRKAEVSSRERPAEALGLCEYILKLEPRNAHAYALKSEILIDAANNLTSLFDRGEYLHMATESLQRALELDDQESIAKLNLGMLRIFGVPIFGNSPNEGISILEGLLERHELNDTRLVKAHYAIGVGCSILGDKSKARLHLSEALKLFPDFSEANVALARLTSS